MKSEALKLLSDGKSFYQVAELLGTTPQEIVKIYAEARANG